MTTAHVHQAVDTLHAALTSADAQLEHLSTRLQSEFSINHPRASPANPYTLLTRLRELQSQLPALREHLLTTHQQKAELAALCRSDLADLTRLARRALPVAAPAGNDAGAAEKGLSQAEDALAASLAAFHRAHAAFVDNFERGVEDSDLNLALLRAAASAQPQTVEDHVAGKENVDAPAGDVNAPDSKERKTKAPKQRTSKEGGKGARPRKTSSESKDASPPADAKQSDLAFVPVSKAVYNRLPRNLKIKAGKLPQINEFYEKVFHAMAAKGSPMSETELKAAAAEDDMQRFEVLRGLAVLRHGKKGWQLAAAKT